MSQSSGSSGKGYDVTSSGTNSQVYFLPIQPGPSHLPTIFDRATTTTAETTLPPPAATKPTATPTTTPTTTVSHTIPIPPVQDRQHRGWCLQNRTSAETASETGSYYYSNSNGSTYHNDGNGGANYTAPGGKK